MKKGLSNKAFKKLVRKLRGKKRAEKEQQKRVAKLAQKKHVMEKVYGFDDRWAKENL